MKDSNNVRQTPWHPDREDEDLTTGIAPQRRIRQPQDLEANDLPDRGNDEALRAGNQ